MPGNSSFLERNIDSIGSWLQRTLFQEKIAKQRGFLQSIDPRVKLVTLLALLVFSMLTHNIWVLASIYGCLLLLAAFSKINILFFLKRVWIFIPIFTAVIAIPALFITKGEPLLSIGVLTITRQGFWGATFLVSRVATAVSISSLLVLTTEWHKLLFALRFLRVPALIILTLAMSYRYICVLIKLSRDSFLARKSRVIGEVSWKSNLLFLSRTISIMFIRALKLGEDVYLAMMSRGFDGEATLTTQQPLRRMDYGWMLGISALIGALAWIG